MAEALVAVGVDELEVAGDVGGEGGVEEVDGGGGGELEGADFAGVGDDGEEAALEAGFGVVGWDGGDELGFHGEEAACDRERAGVDLDAGAADGAVEVGGSGVFAEAEGESFELLVEGCGGVVAGAGDAAAVEVDGGEGLEDVVELAAGEGEGDGGVAGDGAGVLEEAYAVFVEGDAGDGEGLGLVRWGRLLGGGLLGDEGDGEEKEGDGGGVAHGGSSSVWLWA